MSRAAAATSALTSTTEPLHLVVRPNTASLIVSSDDYPNSSVAILPEDLRTFRVIWHWLQMSDQGRNPLFRGKRKTSEPAQEISYSILIALLNFINPPVLSFLMSQLVQGVSASQKILLTQIAQIPQSLSVRFSCGDNAASPLITASNFFNYYAGNLPCLLNASLNADLKTVKRISEKMHLDMLRRLLSAEHGTGFAATCLGRITVERTGTPLQMAIYDHDEEMVAFFKEKMDHEEFERQSKDAFRKALFPKKCAELDCRNAAALEYHQAMQEQQNKDAEKLCAELKDAFKAALPGKFTVDNNYVASTTSTQLPETIGAFINRLTDYVKNNPMHNPFILQRVYEIYDCLASDYNRDCYFSQRVIGGVQSFFSARWLQHYAQGINYLTENNEAPPRSFICRYSSPWVDIRHLVGSCIGSVAFLSIWGGGGDRERLRQIGDCVVRVQTLCLTKRVSFQNSLRGERNRLTAT
jgi:hypothetical protein